MASLPLSTLGRLNTRMLKYFVKRYAVQRGALMFGKMLPVGIGAAIGGGGNRIVGKKIVRNARQAFGSRRRAGQAPCTCCRRSTKSASSRAGFAVSLANYRRSDSLYGAEKFQPPRVRGTPPTGVRKGRRQATALQ